MKDTRSFADILRQSLHASSELPAHSKSAYQEKVWNLDFLCCTPPQMATSSGNKYATSTQFKKSLFSLRGYWSNTPHQPSRPWPLSPAEEAALHLVRRYAPELTNPFRPKQLKRIKHQVFLQTHPDQGGDAEAFRQVWAAFQILESVIKRYFTK